MTDLPTATPGCEELAARWLAAEARASNDPAQTALVVEAALLAEQYEDAIRGASQEDLRLAWEAARHRQLNEEVGSREWADARRVSELLRIEYAASRPEPGLSL